MAQEPLTPQQVRGDALRRLGVRFKSGDTAERRSDDLDKLDKLGIETPDLLEAVERIEVTRLTTTYPPLADLLARCREARSDRLVSRGHNPPNSATEGQPTEAERVQMHDIAKLYRAGQIWCGVCAEYRKHCAEHYDGGYRGPTPEQTADAVAKLPPMDAKPLAAPKPGLTHIGDLF